MADIEQLASRDRILREATRMFIQQGYHRLSMRELAEHAGISKAGIYHHFKDKESLFLAVLCYHLDILEQVVDEAEKTGAHTHDRIEVLVRGILARSPSQRGIIRVARQEMESLSPQGKQTLREAYHQKFVGKITRLFAAGIAAGEIVETDPNILTWALLGILNPYLYPTHGNEKTVPDKTVSDVLKIFFFGVLPR